MSLSSIALILAIVIAVPAALVASWRIWPREGAWNGARALDALWTLVPLVLLVVLIGLTFGAS
jgi:heme/copper-type cytochrome/quinol oxidase subunit 2